MAIVETMEGGLTLWRTILGQPPVITFLRLHLIGTSHTVVHGDTETTLAAVELAVAGYTVLSLSSGSWVISANADGASVSYPLVTWTFTAACTVYGYWLSEQTSTYSLWGETFTAPFIFTPVGGVFGLVLNSYLNSQPFTIGPCQ